MYCVPVYFFSVINNYQTQTFAFFKIKVNLLFCFKLINFCLILKFQKKKYEYPLHQISYCADDKADKKVFCFIAKEPNSDRHSSLVFSSDKQVCIDSLYKMIVIFSALYYLC